LLQVLLRCDLLGAILEGCILAHKLDKMVRVMREVLDKNAADSYHS
jgi:hypothetical protein